MPKDMLDALIERLETEGDQYDHACGTKPCEYLTLFRLKNACRRDGRNSRHRTCGIGRCIRPVHCSSARSPWR